MDPQACLQRLMDAITDKEWEEAFYASEDLYEWLNKGGFAPTVKQPGFCMAISIGGPIAYSVTFNGRSYEFTRWDVAKNTERRFMLLA